VLRLFRQGRRLRIHHKLLRSLTAFELKIRVCDQSGGVIDVDVPFCFVYFLKIDFLISIFYK
jgi:hypothetical protein